MWRSPEGSSPAREYSLVITRGVEALLVLPKAKRTRQPQPNWWPNVSCRGNPAPTVTLPLCYKKKGGEGYDMIRKKVSTYRWTGTRRVVTPPRPPRGVLRGSGFIPRWRTAFVEKIACVPEGLVGSRTPQLLVCHFPRPRVPGSLGDS